MLSAAQVAVKLHVPVPLVIVTVVPLIEHTLPALAVMTAAVLAFVVADTVKLNAYPSVVGAPVKVTCGAILAAVAVCMIVAVPQLGSAAHVAVTEQVPVPLVMVTTAPLIEHTPLTVMVGTDVVVPWLSVATVKVDCQAAVVGTPDRLTFGAGAWYTFDHMLI